MDICRGAVTAVVTSKFAKSNKATRISCDLAAGMQVKDNVEATVTSLKKMLKTSMLKP